MRVLTTAILICCSSIGVWAQQAQADEAPPDQGAVAQVSPPQPAPVPQAAPAPSPYTHAYEVRKDIHKYASFATLPLFATEFALGESLNKDTVSSDSKRGLHAAVGTGLVGLFVVETVTGGWNLWQSRHEKEHRTPRMVHSALMIAANAGFVATAVVTPSRHNLSTFDHDKRVHRNIAIASISIGTAGYLLSLFHRL